MLSRPARPATSILIWAGGDHGAGDSSCVFVSSVPSCFNSLRTRSQPQPFRTELLVACLACVLCRGSPDSLTTRRVGSCPRRTRSNAGAGRSAGGARGGSALANVSRVNPDEPMHRTLLAAGVDLLTAPLYDLGGRVTAEIPGTDVVVSGGVPLDARFFAGLRATRLLLRPMSATTTSRCRGGDDCAVLLNAPDAIAVDVANQAMALILAVNREVPRLDAWVRGRLGQDPPADPGRHGPARPEGRRWDWSASARSRARPPAGRGPSATGSSAHDPHVPADLFEEHGVEAVSLEDLLRQSDVVSIHAS